MIDRDKGRAIFLFHPEAETSLGVQNGEDGLDGGLQRSHSHSVSERGKTDKRKLSLQGFVVSDKMQKTIVVEITRRKLHPIYKKYLTSSKKVKAHDEKSEAKIGDRVRIIECRPLSRDKHWILDGILERAK